MGCCAGAFLRPPFEQNLPSSVGVPEPFEQAAFKHAFERLDGYAEAFGRGRDIHRSDGIDHVFRHAFHDLDPLC